MSGSPITRIMLVHVGPLVCCISGWNDCLSSRLFTCTQTSTYPLYLHANTDLDDSPDLSPTFLSNDRSLTFCEVFSHGISQDGQQACPSIHGFFYRVLVKRARRDTVEASTNQAGVINKRTPLSETCSTRRINGRGRMSLLQVYVHHFSPSIGSTSTQAPARLMPPSRGQLPLTDSTTSGAATW